MNKMRPLKSYEDWKHCITQLCGIPLTGHFIEQRLTSLRDPADTMTQKFVEMWGEQHRLRVIGWFEQAQQDTARTNAGSASSG